VTPVRHKHLLQLIRTTAPFLMVKEWHFVRRPVATAIHFGAYQISAHFHRVERTYVSAKAEQTVLIAAVRGSFSNPPAVLFVDIPSVTFGAFRAFDGSAFHSAPDCTH
jgi:hypothetical protein